MKRDLKSVGQFCSGSPFSQNTVRWWIFQAGENGLGEAGAIVRIGRRVFLDVDRIDQWIEAQQNTRAAA
jgi:hypothetical protein